MSDKRITPEEVVEAYRVTGLKPARKKIYGDTCRCGLGVMAAYADSPVHPYDWANDEYGVPYVDGFFKGFDGWDTAGISEDWNDREWQGYEDGQKCATAVFGAPPMPSKPHGITLTDWQLRAAAAGVLRQVRVPVVPSLPKWIDKVVPSMSPTSWIPQGVYISDPGGFLGKGKLAVRSNDSPIRSPFTVGQVLYGKERWQIDSVTWDDYCGGWEADTWNWKIPKDKPKGRYCIRFQIDGDDGPWRSARTMPYWASRHRFMITRVRCERLQDITPSDSIASGCFPNDARGLGTPEMFRAAAEMVGGPYPRGIFAVLWDQQYGKGSWELNPWCWLAELGPVEGGV